MPLSSGPVWSVALLGKPWPSTMWQPWHSSRPKTSLPLAGSPGGSVNFQPGGTPPSAWSSPIFTRIGAAEASVTVARKSRPGRRTRPRRMIVAPFRRCYHARDGAPDGPRTLPAGEDDLLRRRQHAAPDELRGAGRADLRPRPAGHAGRGARGRMARAG